MVYPGHVVSDHVLKGCTTCARVLAAGTRGVAWAGGLGELYGAMCDFLEGFLGRARVFRAGDFRWAQLQAERVGHYRRLGENAVHARFTGARDFKAVAGILDEHLPDLMVAFEEEGKFRGIVEGFVQTRRDDGIPPRVIELAISVESGWRSRGLARQLIQRAIRVSAAEGIEVFQFYFSYRNLPMRKLINALARESRQDGAPFPLDVAMEIDSGDCIAELRVVKGELH